MLIKHVTLLKRFIIILEFYSQFENVRECGTELKISYSLIKCIVFICLMTNKKVYQKK